MFETVEMLQSVTSQIFLDQKSWDKVVRCQKSAGLRARWNEIKENGLISTADSSSRGQCTVQRDCANLGIVKETPVGSLVCTAGDPYIEVGILAANCIKHNGGVHIEDYQFKP